MSKKTSGARYLNNYNNLCSSTKVTSELAAMVCQLEVLDAFYFFALAKDNFPFCIKSLSKKVL